MTAAIVFVSQKLLCLQHAACVLGHSQCPSVLVLVAMYKAAHTV